MSGKPEDPEKDLTSPEPEKTTTGEEIVELDASTGKPVEKTKSSEPSVSPEELKKIQARIEYQARQLERKERELDERFRQFNQYAVRPVTQSTEKTPERDSDFDEELHQIAQVNYQKAIRIQAQREAEKVATNTFKKLMEEREKQAQVQHEQMSVARSLELSKARVLEEYPSLNDESSDEFKAYYQVYSEELTKDPLLARNPNAPELIMYKMERRLKANPKNPASELERERMERISASASPQGRPVQGKKTIKLTQEELDLCTKSGISPQTYAQIKEQNLKEGVSA